MKRKLKNIIQTLQWHSLNANKKEIHYFILYYYENEKNEFLILSNIVQNEEAEKFFNEQKKDYKKKLNLPSLILAMVMLSMLFIFPNLIMTFHNKSKAKSHLLPINNRSILG